MQVKRMDGSRVWLRDATPISRLSRLRTRMLASSGRCLPMTGTIKLHMPHRSLAGRRSSLVTPERNVVQLDTYHRLHRRLRSDGKTGQTRVDESCQVQGTSRVRRFDQASTSLSHQGPRPSAAHRGRMYGCNLDLLQPERKKRLATGGVHV